MKLEIKHLFTYLPYNVKYAFRCTYDHKNDYESIVNYQNINELELILDNSEYYLLLHPLSDLTKEIEVNGEKFVPIEVLSGGTINKNDKRLIGKARKALLRDILTKQLPYRLIILLHQWHFDIHNLIENGLAIDINTLNQ